MSADEKLILAISMLKRLKKMVGMFMGKEISLLIEELESEDVARKK
jgi:hypothetical protein